MPDPSTDRPKNREVETEDIKAGAPGEPPRTATEPRGAEGSAESDKTRTDPASGEQRANDAGPKELRDTPKVG